MVELVRCPVCGKANSLPIEPIIHPMNGIMIEVWACHSCGAEMDGKEYMQKLKEAKKK